MGSIWGSDRLIQVLFCKCDPCKYPLTKAGATPDGPEFASSLWIFRLVSPAGAGTRRYEKPELWLGTASWHGGFCHAPPAPSGGQAPALHFLIPPSALGLQFGTFRRWRAGVDIDWRAHPGSECGTCFRTNRSSGTPRYEKPELWLGTASWHGGFCHAPPAPSGGQAPALHFLIPPSALGLQIAYPIWGSASLC